jgi:Flp pilus assembly protein TadD
MKYGCFILAPLVFAASALDAQEVVAPTIDQAMYLQQADAALREGRLTQAGQMITWLESNGSEISGDDLALLKAEYAIADRDVVAAAAALSEVKSPERNLCRLQTAKGWVSANLHAYDDAIVALASAAQACPDDAGSWNLLGLVLMRKGESDAAAEAFGRALGVAPNDAGILNNYALALLQKGQLELSIKHLTIAADASPENPLVTANRDFVAGMLGQTPERGPQDSDAVWSARLVSYAQGAKAATNDRQASALFSRAVLTMDRFDQKIWSEISPSEQRP